MLTPPINCLGPQAFPILALQVRSGRHHEPELLPAAFARTAFRQTVRRPRSPAETLHADRPRPVPPHCPTKEQKLYIGSIFARRTGRAQGVVQAEESHARY